MYANMVLQFLSRKDTAIESKTAGHRSGDTLEIPATSQGTRTTMVDFQEALTISSSAMMKKEIDSSGTVEFEKGYLENGVLDRSKQLHLPHELEQLFICLICRDYISSPYVLQCCHWFCCHCLQSWLCHQEKSGCVQNCPACRMPVTTLPASVARIAPIVNYVAQATLTLEDYTMWKNRPLVSFDKDYVRFYGRKSCCRSTFAQVLDGDFVTQMKQFQSQATVIFFLVCLVVFFQFD